MEIKTTSDEIYRVKQLRQRQQRSSIWKVRWSDLKLFLLLGIHLVFRLLVQVLWTRTPWEKSYSTGWSQAILAEARTLDGSSSHAFLKWSFHTFPVSCGSIMRHFPSTNTSEKSRVPFKTMTICNPTCPPLISTELPADRPLWQLHYKNRSSSRPNDSILVFLYHPVLSDAISLMRILLKHIVDNRTTQLDLKPRFAGRRGDHLFDYLKAYLFGHLLLFSKLLFNSSRDNVLQRIPVKTTQINLPSMNTRSFNPSARQVVWSAPFSLTQANRMKLVTRTRMNDLLSTAVMSCLKLYMERYG